MGWASPLFGRETMVTPYRERREKGYYDAKGEGTKSTTTHDLAGLGASQQTKSKAEKPQK